MVINSQAKRNEKPPLEITTNNWNRDNFKVMVIASAKNEKGKFEVVNVALCPVGGSVVYDYK